MEKRATTDHPVHDLIARRWSPRAFEDRPVLAETLGSLFEAARWAPSCFNDQPWTYLVAARGADPEGFERLASCLVPANGWARKAPVLGLSVARLAFQRNGKPNRHAVHDVGLATENLVLQAEALELAVHQMAGFDVERARDVLGVPDGFEPVAMFALGHAGSPDDLPEELEARERAPRTRKPLSEVVRGAGWDAPSPL